MGRVEGKGSDVTVTSITRKIQLIEYITQPPQVQKYNSLAQ